MDLNIEPFLDEDVTIEVDKTMVVINGTIEYTDPTESLEPYFNRIHANALKNQIKQVIIDLTNLNYINSSGITIFVKWIINLQHLPDDKKYTLKFICNPDHKWQKQSISMLAKTAPTIISIA